MSRTENCREPPLTSLAWAGSHVGLCAVDIARNEDRSPSEEDCDASVVVWSDEGLQTWCHKFESEKQSEAETANLTLPCLSASPCRRFF